MKGERSRAAQFANIAADLWANHAMIALIEQAERRHVEYLAAHYPERFCEEQTNV